MDDIWGLSTAANFMDEVTACCKEAVLRMDEDELREESDYIGETDVSLGRRTS